MSSSQLLQKAADGCHKFGWLINLLVMMVMFAYFIGTVNQQVSDFNREMVDVKGQIIRLQDQVYSIAQKVKQ